MLIGRGVSNAAPGDPKLGTAIILSNIGQHQTERRLFWRITVIPILKTFSTRRSETVDIDCSRMIEENRKPVNVVVSRYALALQTRSQNLRWSPEPCRGVENKGQSKPSLPATSPSS
ncbi:uncharacterized protein PHALS_01009 [Plasmopara halstedii]|uniref:Uncharacterized protein n=1 Tax=Plasmopara halstedii TaxID=4781 RepID=A0A0P1ASD8_PLAHL|nr:uncharacterized protein PHALS_01009 [Plasmopara halstedii]CEG44662.1 hypothetical protein PHALS_01009 [Plasmopara halstedii]|eukprot:XP_024581031.1 hypothetical protein PHALS_01009 [Plasmopara halstedii]